MKVQATLSKEESSYGVRFRDERMWNKGSHDWKIRALSEVGGLLISKLEINCRNENITVIQNFKKATAKTLQIRYGDNRVRNLVSTVG